MYVHILEGQAKGKFHCLTNIQLPRPMQSIGIIGYRLTSMGIMCGIKNEAKSVQTKPIGSLKRRKGIIANQKVIQEGIHDFTIQ